MGVPCRRQIASLAMMKDSAGEGLDIYVSAIDPNQLTTARCHSRCARPFISFFAGDEVMPLGCTAFPFRD